MAGVNSTICFDDASLKQCSSSIMCSQESVAGFQRTMGGALWRVNMLVLTNAVLAGVIVAIGAYAQRYRHHPFTRFIFLGATTLLLPITSYIVSTISTNSNDYINKSATLAASCRGGFHYFTAVSWAFLIQITMINTTVIVAVDDREGRNKGPPIQLLVQGVWTLYLGVNAMGPIMVDIWQFYLELMLFAIICSKIVLKNYAFVKARQSFAYGRNPRIVSGYMEQQLQEVIQTNEPLGEDQPPPLLVMGEEANNEGLQPHGYCVDKSDGLVTVEKVWELNDAVFPSMPQLKDMCFSFSLFKLLRCRFARYEHANDRSTLIFFWKFLLKDGNHTIQKKDGNHDRVFRVIADELSFVQDYYFSSLPVSYSKYWLPVLSVIISLLSITYCILATRFILRGLIWNWSTKYNHQLRCHFWCNERHLISDRKDTNFGSFMFDDISLLFLIALVVLAEVKYIASYIFSNWTKVSLICHCIRHAAFKHSLCMRKCFGFMLQCKWEWLMKHWDEKMGQNSILVVHPRTTPLVLLRRLLRLPDLDRSVEIPNTVKTSIIHTLACYRNNWHRLGYGTESLWHNPVGRRFLLFCDINSTSDTILTWHIATSILEMRHPYQQEPQQEPDHKGTATHLSRYCAYLMAWSPDLLPDDDQWSKSRYETVKKDAKCSLAGFRAVAPESEYDYEQVVQLLRDNSGHEVLRNGVRLAQQLVEVTEGELVELTEDEVWKMLAEFWSEMILYIAASDNVRGHLEAIARGGELITLIWALLTHAGIMNWKDDD